MKKRIFSVILTAAIVLLLTPTWAEAYHTGRAGEYPAISVGDNISLAIKTDNSLWAWGSSGNAIFGEQSGPLPPRSTPGKVMDMATASNPAQPPRPQVRQAFPTSPLVLIMPAL